MKKNIIGAFLFFIGSFLVLCLASAYASNIWEAVITASVCVGLIVSSVIIINGGLGN